ncbi:pumilio homolog 1-like protein [Tanacetum coccineum]
MRVIGFRLPRIRYEDVPDTHKEDQDNGNLVLECNDFEPTGQKEVTFAYGLGMSYPGSPLGSPLLPNSALGYGNPSRHGERSLRIPSGIRNLVGGESFASSLLD